MISMTNMTTGRRQKSNRQYFLVFVLIGVLFLLQGCDTAMQTTDEPMRDGNPLAIPALLEDQNPEPDVADFELNLQVGEMEFFPGVTTTLGYNGNYLGPVLKM